MNLRNILLAAGAARLTYLALTHRKTILSEVQETQGLLKEIEANKERIKNQVAGIQAYSHPLQELVADFQYKLRVYQQSIEGNQQEISRTLAKYTAEED